MPDLPEHVLFPRVRHLRDHNDHRQVPEHHTDANDRTRRRRRLHQDILRTDQDPPLSQVQGGKSKFGDGHRCTLHLHHNLGLGVHVLLPEPSAETGAHPQLADGDASLHRSGIRRIASDDTVFPKKSLLLRIFLIGLDRWVSGRWREIEKITKTIRVVQYFSPDS